MVFNRLIKALVIFIAFLFCIGQTTALAAPKQVTLQLFWKHQFEFAGYYAAKELGFYEEAGLDVNIREYQVGMDENEEVLSGRAQFATASSSAIKSYLQGKRIKLLANIFKHSALVLLSHRDAGIRTPGDLYGKRLMLTSQERNAVEFLSFFAKNGIDSKKLSYVDHNFDPMAIVNGQADVMSAYITNQPFILQQKGIPYNILDPAAYGVDFYGDSLITSAKLSEQRPELVEAFKEASLMGWAYALQHPEEIIELILSKYNTTNKSREALRYEATETAKLILPETYPLGSIDPERVRHIANAMYKAGVIKDEPDIEFLIFGPGLKSRLPLTQSDLALTDLTPDEQAWLKNHPVIRVHNEKNWPPFNYFEYGSPRGFSIDYMNLLAERLGFKIEYVTGPSWNEFLGMMRSKELDVMLDIVKTEDRMKYIRYTDPYFRNPNVIVSLQKHSYETIQDLFGKTVAFPKGFSYEEVLTRFFPQIKRLPVEDTLASLKAVTFGKADAALSEDAVVQTLINKNMLIGLRISGEVNIGNPDLVNLHIGVRDDWPLLQSAIMKAMARITPQEMNQLCQKWLIRLTDERARILLTDAERKWLSEHRDISMGVDPKWPPYDFIDKSGKHQGLSADVLALLSKRLGIKIRFVSGLNWSQVLDAARTRELDIVSLLSETPKRAEYLKFVGPITRAPWVIVTSKNFRPVTNLGDMTKDRVAMVKGYAIIELGQKAFPGLTVQTVESPLAGLQAVTTGQMDAYVGNLGVVSYLIRQKGLVNLKIAAEAGVESLPFMIGVRSDWPELVTILNKGLSSISQGEMNAIHQKWIPIEMSALTPKPTAPVSYGRMIIYGIAVFLILSLLVWILIKITKKEDISVSFGSRWFRVLVLAGLSIIIIIVCLLSWFTLERNKEKVLASVGESFRMILNTANDKLNIWVAQKKSFMKLFGRDPELLSITQGLLAVPPNRDGLLVSEALLDARTFFKNNEKIFANIGFFIINPDYISIASLRDANVGIQNLISSQRPDLLKRAFQGEVLFVPSIQSDVLLRNSEFFLGPILDLKGRIIAVMALHADPSKDFSQALHTHGMFKSGETYAINNEGLLLSESRFNDYLRQSGLIEKGQQSALNIEIRDPGVNMVEGHHPILERSEQPLTHIASRAIQLKLDMDKVGQHQGHSKIEVDTKAYRDYRGVPVCGAWLWSADLGFGLATKIDADEALSAYHMMRMTVFGILGFTLLLLVGAILFVLILGERAGRALMKAKDNLEEKIEERTAELRKNQERLALAEERSRLLLDSAGDGIFGVDTKGLINFVNPSAVSMLGYPEEELIGQKVHRLVHHSHTNGSSYPLEYCPMFKAYTDGTSHHVDDEVLWRKDETCFQVEYTATPMKKDGRLAGAVFTFNDTTERKRAQEALRQNMEDLERFSKLAVGREERMIKLKKEINELLRGSGQPDKYKIVD